ncbi:DUF6801 domain-containing protein [Nocardioides panacisoli]|uniref:DUF6801 domain-containing protein n=1 Tax=Nocardioides panacisoli TaxID=627624 RepID=A0ABP7HZH7_9ACTN
MRAPRLIVLALLAALGISVLVAPSPASAVTRTLRTTYLCEVNGNSAHVRARIRVDLPRQLHKGDRMHARRVNVRLVLPASIVDYMRGLGGRSVEGTSWDAFYRVESHQRQIKRLRVPDTDIPSSGPMVLHAHGRAVGYRFRHTGTFPLHAGHAFTTHATIHRGLGDLTSTMGCSVVLGSPTRIGTIRVVR